jgi:hypothetical protein
MKWINLFALVAVAAAAALLTMANLGGDRFTVFLNVS